MIRPGPLVVYLTGFFIEMNLLIHIALWPLAVAVVTVAASLILTLLILRRVRKSHPALYAVIATLPGVIQRRQYISRILADPDAVADNSLMGLVGAFRKFSAVSIWSIGATFFLIVAGFGVEVLSNQ